MRRQRARDRTERTDGAPPQAFGYVDLLPCHHWLARVLLGIIRIGFAVLLVPRPSGAQKLVLDLAELAPVRH